MESEKIIDELIAAARSAGIAVREAPLSSGELKARSGLITLRGKPVLFLDTGLSPPERIELISQALCSRDLTNIYLSPQARSMIENAETPDPAGEKPLP